MDGPQIIVNWIQKNGLVHGSGPTARSDGDGTLSVARGVAACTTHLPDTL